MTELTPFTSLAGGALIGLASALLLWMNGRIAGISGILGGLAARDSNEIGWRLAFGLGLVGGGLLALQVLPNSVAFDIDRSSFTLAIAGLLVGFGTRLGGGCTSGHGVCGLSLLSRRSFVSVVTFMVVAGVTVFLHHELLSRELLRSALTGGAS